MKRFLAVLALTFLSTIAHATTSLYESGSQGLPSSGFFNYYMPTPPQLDGSGYSGDQPLGVGFNADMSFGSISCGGMNLPNMFASFSSNITQTIDYAYSNALSLAFNYLVYSSPALYQILQDTHRNFSKYLGMSVNACEAIHNLAKNSRLHKEAVGLCMTDKQNAAYCSNDSNLSHYLKLAATKEAKGNGAVASGLPFSGSNSNGGNSKSTGQTVSFNSLITGSYPLTAASNYFLTGLLPSVKHVANPSAGQPSIQIKPRTIMLHQVIQCRARYYSKAINAAVTAYIQKDKSSLTTSLNELNPPNSGSGNVASKSTTTPNLQPTSSSVEQYCNPGSGLFSPVDNTGGVPVTDETIYELAQMKQTSTLDYSIAVNSLAQSHALAYGDYLVGQITTATMNAESSGQQAALFQADNGAAVKAYNAAISLLSKSMKTMHLLHQDALEQQQVMKSIAQFNNQNNNSATSSQPLIQ